MQWRAGDRFAGDEAPARHVIARIEAIEGEPHALQLFGPIGIERFLGLRAPTPRSLLREQAIECRIGGELFGMFSHGRTEGGPRIGQHGVGQAKLQRYGEVFLEALAIGA